MITTLAEEINEMSKLENSDINTLGQLMQKAVLTFGGTLLMYLETLRTDAMNGVEEQSWEGNDVGTAYWNGRFDMANQLIDMLQPFANSD